MSTPLRVLVVDDSKNDAWLMVQQLECGGYAVTSERVDSAATMQAALGRQDWDIVISDYTMRGFSGLTALALCKEKDLDLPFILVSGAIGEDVAVTAMRAGAHDYLMKGNLSRLAPAVERELRDAEVRRERQRAEAALRRAHDELEMRVQERTAELARANAALQANEARATALLNAIPDSIFRIDRQGVFLDYKAEDKDLYLDRQHILGAQISEIMPPEFADLVARQIRATLETGALQAFEYQLPAPDRGVRDYEARMVVSGADEVTTFVRDITEHKRAGVALRDSEERYRALVETSPDPITVTGLDGRLHMVNRRTAELHGFASVDDMINMNAFDLIASEDWSRAQDDILKTLRAGQIRDVEYTFLRKDGTRFPVEMCASVITDAQGSPTGLIGMTRDITERKRVEQEVWSSTERYRRLADNFPNGSVITYNRDLRVTFVAGQELLESGRTAEFFVGKHFTELAPPETIRIAEPHLRAAFAGKVGNYETAYYDHQCYYVVVTPLTETNGAVEEIMVVALNITERRQAEEARSRLAGIVEFSDDAIIGKTLEGVITSWNRGAEKTYGYAATEVIGQPISILTPHNRVNELAGILERLKQGESIEHFETVRRGKDGRLVYVSLGISPIRDATGQIVGASTIARDITARKRAEEELKRRNEDLIALNAIAMVVSQVVVPGDVLRMALETVLKLTGAKTGTIEMCGGDPGQVTHTIHCGPESSPGEDDVASQARDSVVREVLRTGQPVVLSADMISDRSSTEPARDGSLPCVAVLIKSKRTVLGVMMLEGEAVCRMDPSDIQLLTAIGREIGLAIENAQLAKDAAELKILRELERLQSELIANVSHELRTPLGLIKLFSSTLLVNGFEFDNETQQQFLTVIDQETDRLGHIVDNLLDVSRLQNGRLRLNKQATDLTQLIRQVVKRIELPLTRHQLIQHIPDHAVMAMADPLRFEQVLWNLLSNAIKYSPNGGNIEVQLHGDTRQILISVRDAGIGISSHDLERIFDRFYRVENKTTETIGGLGLGLAVSRGIVEAHGGQLWAESTFGVGSSFYVSLPVGDVDKGQ